MIGQAQVTEPLMTALRSDRVGHAYLFTGPRGTALAPPRWTAPTPNITTVTRSANSATYAPALRLAPAGMTTCTVRHIVYYPDATVIRQRAEAALTAGWSGVAIWAMGYEDVSMYQALGGVAAQRPNGDPTVSLDEPLLEISTDKVDAEIPSPAAGVLTAINVKEGETVTPGALLGQITEGAVGATQSAPAAASKPAPTTSPAPAARRWACPRRALAARPRFPWSGPALA